MLSVLPRREDSMRMSALFGTLRYMWELATSTKNHPPCTSGIWMIDRRTLLGVIEQSSDLAKQMRIEHTIAHAARKTKQYRYLIAKKALGLRYEKRWHSQVETAQRLYYPMFGGTPWHALLAIVWLVSLSLPVVTMVFLRGTDLLLAIISVIISMLWYGFYTIIVRRPSGALAKTLLWPYLILQDIVLLIYSFARYSTRSVTWKGRHIKAQPRNHSHIELN